MQSSAVEVPIWFLVACLGLMSAGIVGLARWARDIDQKVTVLVTKHEIAARIESEVMRLRDHVHEAREMLREHDAILKGHWVPEKH